MYVMPNGDIYATSFKAGSSSSWIGPQWNASGSGGITLNAQHATGDIIFRAGSATEFMRLRYTGYLGVGTTTPAALLHANNSNVLSKPLFRLGRDQAGLGIATPDSVALGVTGSGKTVFGVVPGSPGKNTMADTSLANFVVASTVTAWDSLKTHKEASNIADDGTIVLPTGVSGFGSVSAHTIGTGALEQWADFVFDIDGTVTLKQNSAKVSRTTSAGDDSLMVYDAGSGIAIKNRLGATKTLKVIINW